LVCSLPDTSKRLTKPLQPTAGRSDI
jgi:hypothetical protein